MTRRCLVTGGGGFIGVNLADYHLVRQAEVTILDDFSRPGSRENVRWLRRKHSDRALRVVEADVRHCDELDDLTASVDVVFHLAAQVAVTRSVADPIHDFEVNARGTLNLLESVRKSGNGPIFVYASTNKVYGRMADVPIAEEGDRYRYRELSEGVGESRRLSFHSPYGCSKGAADQYVLDYARVYGLRTVVFRQSCIYGPHQYGMEDQGWLAWFVICALRDRPITIYGDGKQVRDVLHVDDLLTAYDAAVAAIDRTAGRAFNIGGGPSSTLSLLELLGLLEREFGREIRHGFGDWRPGDQRVYVSDVSRAREVFGWSPEVTPEEGVSRLVSWLSDHIDSVPAR